jgi:glycosyltransferase involved in cell wall biosynthesis
VAALLSTAGWAAAAERVLGQSWVVTPTGVLTPSRARQQGSDPALRGRSEASVRRRLPKVAKTAVKDLLHWRLSRRFSIDPDGPWSGPEVTFVWQRHDLFNTAGLDLAQRLGVPSVLFVPATKVWEAEQWGTTRPAWGRLLESRAERPLLLGADLVACGSRRVVDEVVRMGVPKERVLLTPTGVDLDLFTEPPDPTPLRRHLGLVDRFVVGWVGSFRRFHALEQAVEAVAAVPGTALLLVGDGPERARIQRLARHLGATAVFTGTVAHPELPAYLAAMDAAVIVAPPGQPFHYSPLKLAEYLAAGLPVVAPAAGQLAERLTDGVDAIVVPPHNVDAVAAALRRLRDDHEERARLGKAARVAAEAEWSWDHQVRRVIDALDRSPDGQARHPVASAVTDAHQELTSIWPSLVRPGTTLGDRPMSTARSSTPTGFERVAASARRSLRRFLPKSVAEAIRVPTKRTLRAVGLIRSA